MKEGKKSKVKKEKSKKIIVLFGIALFLVVVFFAIVKLAGIQINGNAQGAETADGTEGQAQVENTPAPTCYDSIQNQGEGGVDCSGPCSNVCPPTCSDGILNQDETAIDCGGKICAACAQRPAITDAQRTLISQTIIGSPMIKDLPSNGVIALRFYDFFLGERIWQPDILIGKTGILTSGTPDMVLIMHERYIDQLNGSNLCDVITSANKNGEMWMESSLSTTKLLLKYSGMMKYKSCFGM